MVDKKRASKDNKKSCSCKKEEKKEETHIEAVRRIIEEHRELLDALADE